MKQHGPVPRIVCETGPEQGWVHINGRAPRGDEEAWDHLRRWKGPGNVSSGV